MADQNILPLQDTLVGQGDFIMAALAGMTSCGKVDGIVICFFMIIKNVINFI